MLSFARSVLSSCRMSTPLTRAQAIAPPNPFLGLNFARFRSQLAPMKIKYIRRHKGIIPIPTGGSVKGTTLAFGDYGIRIKGNGMRISAKQLVAAEDVLKRKLKTIKGVKVYMRVFPDIPVCVKGNETRMGKGKGSFEFWATRVAPGRVLFEIGGAPIRKEIAKDALRQAMDKLPPLMEFIDKNSPPRLGNLLIYPEAISAASTPAPEPILQESL